MIADPFLEPLPEVCVNEVVIAPDDINAEARGNLWSFALTSNQAAALGLVQVTSFVRAVAAAWDRQLSARGAAPMLLYCWHDEQAAGSRLSLVSAGHGRLPFRRAIDDAAPSESVASSFLGSLSHDGIPFSTPSEDGPEGERDAVGTLPVWVFPLPSSSA